MQSISPPGEIFRSPEGGNMILEIGDAQSGMELAHACHGFLRFRQSPGERTACRGDHSCAEMIWLLPCCGFRPGGCLGIAAGNEMSGCGGHPHLESMGIVWAQPHGAS